MNSIRITNAPAPAATARPVPLQVLVVDDLPEICSLFRDAHRRLRGMVVELTTETNSERALELVRSKKFDLVVSDFRMKEVDGIEILIAARAADPRGHRILMTGYNEIPTSLERIKQAHVDAYVQKPIRGPELIVLLTDFLRGNITSIDEHRAAARALEEDAEEES